MEIAKILYKMFIFVDDFIAYAFVGFSFSDAQCIRGEYLNESHKVIY